MRSHELTTGRTFGVTFSHGEDFFDALGDFCAAHDIVQGYIPMFLAGFAEATVVGTCEPPDDADAPVWGGVTLTGVEALGCGTLAYVPGADQVMPHIHTALGEKFRGGAGYTSHLLGARVQFLTELLIVEVCAPLMTRRRDPDLYDVPLLSFGP